MLIAYHKKKIVSKFATVFVHQSNESFMFKRKTNFHEANIARKITFGFSSWSQIIGKNYHHLQRFCEIHVGETLWVIVVDMLQGTKLVVIAISPYCTIWAWHADTFNSIIQILLFFFNLVTGV